MSKTWCKHIKWSKNEGWWFRTTLVYWAAPSWRYCPICGAKRPSNKPKKHKTKEKKV